MCDALPVHVRRALGLRIVQIGLGATKSVARIAMSDELKNHESSGRTEGLFAMATREKMREAMPKA